MKRDSCFALSKKVNPPVVRISAVASVIPIPLIDVRAFSCLSNSDDAISASFEPYCSPPLLVCNRQPVCERLVYALFYQCGGVFHVAPGVALCRDVYVVQGSLVPGSAVAVAETRRVALRHFELPGKGVVASVSVAHGEFSVVTRYAIGTPGP